MSALALTLWTLDMGRAVNDYSAFNANSYFQVLPAYINFNLHKKHFINIPALAVYPVNYQYWFFMKS